MGHRRGRAAPAFAFLEAPIRRSNAAAATATTPAAARWFFPFIPVQLKIELARMAVYPAVVRDVSTALTSSDSGDRLAPLPCLSLSSLIRFDAVSCHYFLFSRILSDCCLVERGRGENTEWGGESRAQSVNTQPRWRLPPSLCAQQSWFEDSHSKLWIGG